MDGHLDWLVILCTLSRLSLLFLIKIPRGTGICFSLALVLCSHTAAFVCRLYYGAIIFHLINVSGSPKTHIRLGGHYSKLLSSSSAVNVYCHLPSRFNMPIPDWRGAGCFISPQPPGAGRGGPQESLFCSEGPHRAIPGTWSKIFQRKG